MGKIDEEFSDTIKHANILDGLSDQISALAINELRTTLLNMSDHWRGESAQLYISNGDIIKEELLDTAQELRSLSKDIKDRAKWIYEVEKTTNELINKK